jgi:broad specificity phosphatase PhoE
MMDNKMSNIYLLRHCDYENPRKILPGRLPVELSESGKKRANQLKDIFKDKNISKIYSSEVLRCKQTAEIVAGGQIPVIFDKRLLETLSAYQGYWVQDWDHFFGHEKAFGGESIIEVRDRAVDFYKTIKKTLKPDENIIICSHGDPLQTLYAYLKNIPLSNEKHLPESKKFGWFEKGEFFKLDLS